MPDQNNPTDVSSTPTQVNPTSDPTQMPAPSAPMDIPPTDADASVPPPFPPEGSPVEAAAPPADSGSAAPSFDIPPVVTPGQPKKKFGGKRVIATILGLLVLVGGLGAGVILVRQQQDIREKAALAEPCNVCLNKKCTKVASPPNCSSSLNECGNVGGACGGGGVCTSGQTDSQNCTTGESCPGKKYRTCTSSGQWGNFGACEDIADNCPAGPTAPPPTATPNICALSQRDPNSQGYCDRSAPNTPDCTDKDEGDDCTIRSQCGGGTGKCVVINQGGANSECQCQKGAAPPPPPTKTPTPTKPPGGGPTAQCLDIKAFDVNWTQLTVQQLSQFKAGDKVRFTVAGQTSGGSFDKARFKINGVQRPEVTGKRPTTEEYFDEYTIPEGITTFSINAQIHHTTLGWSN